MRLGDPIKLISVFLYISSCSNHGLRRRFPIRAHETNEGSHPGGDDFLRGTPGVGLKGNQLKRHLFTSKGVTPFRGLKGNQPQKAPFSGPKIWSTRGPEAAVLPRVAQLCGPRRERHLSSGGGPEPLAGPKKTVRSHVLPAKGASNLMAKSIVHC